MINSRISVVRKGDFFFLSFFSFDCDAEEESALASSSPVAEGAVVDDNALVEDGSLVADGVLVADDPLDEDCFVLVTGCLPFGSMTIYRLGA